MPASAPTRWHPSGPLAQGPRSPACGLVTESLHLQSPSPNRDPFPAPSAKHLAGRRLRASVPPASTHAVVHHRLPFLTCTCVAPHSGAIGPAHATSSTPSPPPPPPADHHAAMLQDVTCAPKCDCNLAEQQVERVRYVLLSHRPLPLDGSHTDAASTPSTPPTVPLPSQSPAVVRALRRRGGRVRESSASIMPPSFCGQLSPSWGRAPNLVRTAHYVTGCSATATGPARAEPARRRSAPGNGASHGQAAAGIEPANKDFADPCLTTWLRRREQAGAENGIRTRDPQLGKLLLYQLSYFRPISKASLTPGGGLSRPTAFAPHAGASLIPANTRPRQREGAADAARWGRCLTVRPCVAALASPVRSPAHP